MALTEKQLEERRHYIGGSDVGAILGFNHWKTALDVYFEKVEGKRPEINNNFIYWGNQLEPLIRDIFSEVTGLETKEVTETKYHKDHKFIAANIDGMINLGADPVTIHNFGEKGGKLGESKYAILEIKTVSNFARAQWGKPKCDLDLSPEQLFLPNNGFKNDDGHVPMNYLCQVILYAAVYEIKKVYLTVYFGNDLPLQIYQYNRDLELEKQVLDKLIYFWKENVEKEIPPDPSTKAEICDFYKECKKNTSIVATNETEDFYFKIKQLKDQKKSIEEQIEMLSCKVMKFMGNDEILMDNAGSKLASWIGIVSKRLDTTKLKTECEDLYKKYIKESKYRQFKIY